MAYSTMLTLELEAAGSDRRVGGAGLALDGRKPAPGDLARAGGRQIFSGGRGRPGFGAAPTGVGAAAAGLRLTLAFAPAAEAGDGGVAPDDVETAISAAVSQRTNFALERTRNDDMLMWPPTSEEDRLIRATKKGCHAASVAQPVSQFTPRCTSEPYLHIR